MIDDELLEELEQQAKSKEADWKNVRQNCTSSMANLRELGYWRDVVPYKHIVRMVRLKKGIPLCDGATDCLESNLGLCDAGKHHACREHSSSCIFCRSKH